jgi:hypothetical protein
MGMRNITDDHIPDELKIEQLLSDFKPQPSSRYINRMRSAPWQRREFSKSSSHTKNGVLQLKPGWVLALIIIVLAIITLSFIPSVRVAADQFIHFFLPASSNQLEVQVTPANPLDLMDVSNPSTFSLNVDEVQQQAGYSVKQISSPSAPAFIGARYEDSYNAVLLLYKGEGYTLLVTQRPLGNNQDVFSVGSSAHVEFVTVGSVQAEYVVGGWKAVSTPSSNGTPVPPGTVNLSAVWDDNLPQFTLRWQESGFAYELRSNGENSPSQSQLINLSNGLK